jgi:alpha-galactosidase
MLRRRQSTLCIWSIAALGLQLSAAYCSAAELVPLSNLNLDNQPKANAKANTSADGSTLTINGEKYQLGLGVKAPSKIVIDLKRGAERFLAKVGLDDEVPDASAQIVVSGDDRRLWPFVQAPAPRGRGQFAPSISAGTPPQTIDVDVKGVRVLVLEVSRPGGGRGGPNAAAGPVGHVDWVNAALIVSGDKPEIPKLPEEETVVLTPKEAETPRINCAKVFGVRPGHPFLFTIATTGKRPLEFSAQGLPTGLTLNPTTGFITGKADAKGEHLVKLHAKNSLGSADSTLKIVVGDTICLTPALGWNSWNCFGPQVTAQNVMDAADAMANSGLVNHGWTYVNTDDYWETNNSQRWANDPTLHGDARAENGTINTNKRFPDMKALTDHIHSLGLKAGIYSSPGPTTCGGCTASWQHEEQDAKTFADWGFDYLKYDWCSYDSVRGGRPQMTDIPALKKPYEVMNDALHKLDRDIVFSLCQYGWGDVWNWGADVGGNSWRTTGDITDTWQSLTGIWDGQTERNGQPTNMADRAGPGHFNDADMMIVGMVSVASGQRFHPTSLSPNEQYTHVTAWIMMACPMLIGCDMTKFDDFTLGLLTNDEVLAVNQDPLGKAGRRKIDKVTGGGFEVWTKELEDGSKAVGIFNRSELEGSYTLKFSDVDIKGQQSVRDLWRQKDLGKFTDQFETTVPRHGVVLVRLTPQ